MSSSFSADSISRYWSGVDRIAIELLTSLAMMRMSWSSHSVVPRMVRRAPSRRPFRRYWSVHNAEANRSDSACELSPLLLLQRRVDRRPDIVLRLPVVPSHQGDRAAGRRRDRRLCDGRTGDTARRTACRLP